MKSFSEINYSDFKRNLFQRIMTEISSKGKAYILQIDEPEYIDYLVNQFSIAPLIINLESEIIYPPVHRKERMRDDYFDRNFEVDTWSFTISYQFSGTAELFKVKPNPYTWCYRDINVSGNFVSFEIKIFKQDAEIFKKTKSEAYSEAFTNITNINHNIREITESFKKSMTDIFSQEKEKYKNENDFFTAINVKANPKTENIFTVPAVVKKIIPQPTISKNAELSSQPTISKVMYDDILEVIYNLGKSMEKKPSTYAGKDEEALRDQILLFLETRYQATTATGETFNRGGKTDIILKYANDNSNIFVAECKFWHGTGEFLKAISQLFDRYLTWRDSKVSLILFVRNKDFSNVLNTIREEVKSHPYFVKENGDKGESSFSYIFHLPQDVDKKVYLEIMAFHYDK